MNAGQWWNVVGSDAMNELCDAVGTSRAYFYRIVHGHAQPGPKMAAKMATESLRISGVGMTVDSLLKMDHLPVGVIVGDRAVKA